MGDAPPRSSSAGGFPGQEAVTGDFTAPGLNENKAVSGQTQSPPDGHHNFQQQQYPQQYGSAQQHAFASQFDAAQTTAPGRPGPYNMSTMMNALPPAHYGRGQFSTGNQRYNPGGVPATVNGQIQATTQYASGQAALGGLPNQQYYIPQPAQLQHYYGPMPPGQQHGNMSPRTAMSYYSGQVVMGSQQGHTQTAYYYPQGGHFPGQSPSMQPQMVAGQYLSSTPPQPDPRLPRHHSVDTASRTAFFHSQEQGNRKNHFHPLMSQPYLC